MDTPENSVPKYVRVALPLPLDKLFTYAVPEEYAHMAMPGYRALVPFGRRILTGFITESTDDAGGIDPGRIKPLHDIIDDEPVFDAHMLQFCGWIAEYYLSSTGEVLKTAMPAGTMLQSRLMISRADGPPDDNISLTPLQLDVYGEISRHERITARKLQKAFKQSISGVLNTLAKKGLITLDREITSPSVKPKTERHVFLRENPDQRLSDRATKQQECREVLRANPHGIPLADLLERHGFSRGVVNALVDGGFARYEDIEITRRSALLDQENTVVDHPLSGLQKTCLKDITSEAEKDSPRPVLLHGVTGSGKTRLYIELVRAVLKKGQSAIILVPEIALTPQTTRFFTSAFPGDVAVLHSAMSPGERYDMWRTIHDGKARIVIGPRSAVFAPAKDPGIIIVDEEHDGSYKQDDTSPRYHARDAAVVRGNLLGIPVILGSATPSMESWHNAANGKYLLASLPERVTSKPLPEVITVNMKDERAAENYSALSLRLRDEIAARLGTGEKSIVLINRRGFASNVHCGECGYLLTCPECAVGLTWHASKRLAVCHICGHKQLVLEHCPECGETNIEYRGMGTQKIEEELAQITEDHSAILRMDSDTTGTHDGHHKLLEEFRNGDVPILLGTQMVAKGLDFPDVTLVGIVSADLSLFLPDFRAFERTFQLVTQVSGRAGRGDKPGTVILQTFDPENHAIAAASRQDFEGFAVHELAAREELAYPPFSRLILIEIGAERQPFAESAARDIAVYLSSNLPDAVEVLGPVEAPIARKKGRHRMHILIKAKNPHPYKQFIRKVVNTFTTGKEDVVIDVDPLDLM